VDQRRSGRSDRCRRGTGSWPRSGPRTITGA
jgi:hypothetical protein